MDEIDKQIIRILQKNAELPLSEISKKVGLSTTPCWNRIRKLEEEDVILSRSVCINRYSVELPVMIFLSISVSSHTKEWADSFADIINKYDCILEAHRLTGAGADYQLKIVAKSIDEYDTFQQKLINELDFVQMASSISLRELKDTRELPIR
tara:strand:- start:77 stop:532 length:456 start_codon:yes stop_codon:yes gene_type:complete